VAKKRKSAGAIVAYRGWTRWPTTVTDTTARELECPRGLKPVSSARCIGNQRDYSTTMNVGNLRRRLTLAVRQDGLLRWLARLASKRGVSLALIAAILIVDLVIPWAGLSYLPRWQGLSFVPRALVDEPCAVATALIVLGAITRFRGSPPEPKFGWTMLACSVLIDLDHLPAEFGTNSLTNGTPRPYPHALWTVIVLTLAWSIARYVAVRKGRPRPAIAELILAGATWGVAAHFLRDIATAPMSFWWPLTDMAVQVPYWWYVTALLVIIALGPVRRGKYASAQQSRDQMSANSSV
jgi:hypothetical protein